jgi:hypothetical protein
MNDDEQYLRWLSVGHYVAAVLAALVACIPIIHLTVGIVLLLNPPGGDPDAWIPGLVLALVGGALVLAGWSLAAAIFMAGRSIAARKRFGFCVGVAALACAFAPFGTVLGVLSLVVLLRPSVRALSEQAKAGVALPPAPPPPGSWRDDSSHVHADV